jgi:hypothetical protein
MMYDPFTYKFPVYNSRYSASVAYPLPFILNQTHPNFWLMHAEIDKVYILML